MKATVWKTFRMRRYGKEEATVAERLAAFLERRLRASVLAFAGRALAVLAAVAPSPAAASEPSPARPTSPLSDADFRKHPDAKIELGRLLFYDKALSGNRNIACGACHDHGLASGDGLSLGLGEGAEGLGRYRRAETATDAVRHRVPRNAPALFNLGATSITHLLWDGRVAVDPDAPSGFDTPAEDQTPLGLDSVVAGQALFPLLSEIEMAGEAHENDVALAASRREALGWREIATRVQAVPAYAPLFQAAFPDVVAPRDIEIRHIANAIGAFVDTEWRADQSPFDQWLRGDDAALSPLAKKGAQLFYGEAGCASCHAGPLQTDNRFHAIAMPQIGPGKMAGMSSLPSDFGRLAITGDMKDAYRFKTPSLRNVAETAPYGHAGAYRTLEAVVRHHLDPAAAFTRYDLAEAVLPSAPALEAVDGRAMADPMERQSILDANALAPVALSEAEIAQLLAFLHALTDETSLNGRLGKPAEVPSGLPVDR